MTTQPSSQPKKRITPLRVGAIIVILLCFFFADLQFRGLVWGYIYNQTGEETVVGQIQGMIEFGGNFIRLPLQQERYTPIQHTDIFPYGVNTFFEQETELDKMRVQFQMIVDAGFGWIRQEFPWEDIEVDGRGQYTDTRFDYDGDGQNDTISAWDKYDQIVDLAEEYQIGMIVRLSNPPAWSRAENPETEGGAKAPPDNFQDFVNFAVAVAERYQGRIQYYQVWNEPNIYPEWGEQLADPVAYTELLCMTYDALKAVDPNIVVISGTIAPTNSLDRYWGYHDLVYLQNMYDSGAGDCFDVLSAQGYGLNSGPTDRRQRVTHLSLARHLQYRDMMVAYGDAHKPIWLSEVAWSPVETTCLQTGECIPRETIGGVGNFGSVTEEQAANYLVGAFERAREEWTWIGHISYWHFTRRTIEEANGVAYWFRMVEADYSPETPTFSPLPVYYSAQEFLTETRVNPVLYIGVHQVESWEISLTDSAEPIFDDDAEFGTAIRTDDLRFSANGTSLKLRFQSDTPLLVVRDGNLVETIAPDPSIIGWQTATVSIGTFANTHEFSITSPSEFMVDSITVYNNSGLSLLPICIGALGLLALIIGFVYPQWRFMQRDKEIEAKRRNQIRIYQAQR